MARSMTMHTAHQREGHVYLVLTITEATPGTFKLAWNTKGGKCTSDVHKFCDKPYAAGNMLMVLGKVTGLSQRKFEESLLAEIARLQNEGQDVFTFLPITFGKYWLWFSKPVEA